MVAAIGDGTWKKRTYWKAERSDLVLPEGRRLSSCKFLHGKNGKSVRREFPKRLPETLLVLISLLVLMQGVGVLQSQFFADEVLCPARSRAYFHGTVGDHVSKIQVALAVIEAGVFGQAVWALHGCSGAGVRAGTKNMRGHSMKLVRVMVIGGAFASACACSGAKPGPAQAAVAGTTAQADSAPRIADPCKLLTQAEASEAIGTKLEAGELKRFGGITRCVFYNNRDNQQLVLLDVRNESSPTSDSGDFESDSHNPNAKPVPGIEDQAFWFHNELGSSLEIFKGGRLVRVTLPRRMTTMTPALEKAARLIASRM